MKLIIQLILVILTTLMCTNTAIAQVSAADIIKTMEDRMRGESSYSEMKMTTVRPRYTREVTMKTWAKGEDFSLILITGPARDKGTAYLKRGKEIWNYVPNIDRMIKMPPSMMSQSWMGSDFSNDDLVRESSTIDDYKHRIVRSETYNGYSCWVLELVPRPESSIVYGKVLMWVAKDLYVQLKVENYDEDEILVSSVLFDAIKDLGGRKIPSKMEVIPADKKNQKTVLEYFDARFNFEIKESFFSQQNLKNL